MAQDELDELAKLRRAIDPLSTIKDMYRLYSAQKEQEPLQEKPIGTQDISVASQLSQDPEVLEARRRISEGTVSGLLDAVGPGVGPALGITKKVGKGFLTSVDAADDLASLRNRAKQELGISRLRSKPIESNRFEVRKDRANGIHIWDNLKKEVTIYNLDDKSYAESVAESWNAFPNSNSITTTIDFPLMRKISDKELEKQSSEKQDYIQKLLLDTYKNPRRLTRLEHTRLVDRKREIERKINELPDEHPQIDGLNSELDSIIQTLTESYKKSKIAESGLKLVDDTKTK